MKLHFRPRSLGNFSLIFVFIMLSLPFTFESCQDDIGLLPSIKNEITIDYLLNGNLDVYLQNNQIFRLKGKPGIVNIPLGLNNLSDYEDCFILYVASGSGSVGTVASAIIKLDGQIVMNTSDFDNISSIHKFEVCNLSSQSILEVEVRGTPGSFLDIWIEGKRKGLTVTDCEGNRYKTVTIGDQIWMAENLKSTKYNDCSSITNVSSYYDWSILTSGAYAWYNNDATTNKNLYGGLYNWYAVNTHKLCPTGWHIPSNSEWIKLETFIGGSTNGGGKLKETGTNHWNSPNTGATDEFGFTALPGGYRYLADGYLNLSGHWWTSTEGSSSTAYYRGIGYIGSEIVTYNENKEFGLSVRCIKNSPLPIDGLVAYYPFNGNANDESGNGYNGTVYGPILTTDRFEKPNSAWNFTEYNTIDMGNILSEVFESNVYTISLWYNMTVNGGLINKWQNCCPNTGNNAFWTAADGFWSNTKGYQPFTNPPINQWVHWLITMNSGTLQVYINGELVLTDTGYYSVASDMNLKISSSAGGGNSFIGKVDDVRIYNKILTLDEILSLYHEDGW
jgi:uncharacterized protein (TIGR02145 family)